MASTGDCTGRWPQISDPLPLERPRRRSARERLVRIAFLRRSRVSVQLAIQWAMGKVRHQSSSIASACCTMRQIVVGASATGTFPCARNTLAAVRRLFNAQLRARPLRVSRGGQASRGSGARFVPTQRRKSVCGGDCSAPLRSLTACERKHHASRRWGASLAARYLPPDRRQGDCLVPRHSSLTPFGLQWWFAIDAPHRCDRTQSDPPSSRDSVAAPLI
jgi:hypothetical protein